MKVVEAGGAYNTAAKSAAAATTIGRAGTPATISTAAATKFASARAVATNNGASGSSGARMAEVIAIKEGADLDLSCPIVVQNEDMIISWTCENELANIKSSRIHVTKTGKLRIRSAKLGDSCNYRCEAADGFGTLSVIIKVIIIDKRMMDQIGTHNQTITAYKAQTVNQNQSPDPIIQLNSADRTQKMTGSIGSGSSGSLRGNSIGVIAGGNSDLSSTTTTVIDLHQPVDEQQQRQQTELEVQVEPMAIHVDKNRTFSLECRVKHAPHLTTPQIIWLKEFIGRKPDSLTEAHEQNLVMIDNVYYHSLNWPRSMTNTRNTACANSVLLVRQSNFVHSGNYICFAGYPPSTMSSNLSLTATTHSETRSLKTHNSEHIIHGSSLNTRPLKYKMAMARVEVNDKEGERRHKLTLEANSDFSSDNVDNADGSQGEQKNLLIGALTTNSWARNLTALLLISCITLYVLKLVYVNYVRVSKKPHQLATTDEPGDPLAQATTIIAHRHQDYTQLAIKQIQSSNYSAPTNSHRLSSSSTSQQRQQQQQQRENESFLQVLDIESQLDEKSTPKPLKLNHDTDHLYSEIGERFNNNNRPRTTTSNGEQIYRTPNNNRRSDQWPRKQSV